MAPPVHYLRPGEQADIQAWLSQKLQEERREVLLTLESKHRQLLEQFMVRASQGEAAPLAVYPTWKRLQSTPSDPRSTLAPPPDRLMPVAGDPDQCEPEEVPKAVESNEVEELEVQENGVPKLDLENKPDEKKGDDLPPPLISSSSTVINLDASAQFEHSKRGQAFEWFFGCMIFVNALIMAMNQQYKGLQRGYDLSYDEYYLTKEEAWPGGELTFDIFEKFFTILFTIEFICRWVIFRFAYLKDYWCYVDGTIIALAWVIFVDKHVLSFNPTFVRLVRVTKLLRLVRLLRSNQMFDCLKLLVSAIKASFNVLFWSLCVLVLIISVGSLFMTQMLESFLGESHDGDDEKLKRQRIVFRYFGTFWRALLTMFEVTFANWVPSMRVLVENVAEAYGLFFLLYRCVIGLAVLMVVQAVFIQQTMKSTQLDDESLANQKKKAKAKLLRRLENVFRRLDSTGDGTLDKEEFEQALQQPEMVSMLEVFELEVSDIDVLFKLLDDGDGNISVDEFVAGVEHVKGGARAIDLMELKQDLKKLSAGLLKTMS